MQKLDLFDETFDPFRTESYELSIQVSLNGFSFCVKDSSRNMFIALGSTPFEKSVVLTDDWLQQVSWITNQYDWLKKQFRKVIISYESPEFTVVPNKYFEASKAKSLLELSFPIHELNEIRFNDIDSEKVCIYSIPYSLTNGFLSVYKNAKFVSSGCVSLNSLLSVSIKKDKPQLHITFFDSFAVLNVVKESILCHSGSIQLINSEDTTYHIANIAKQLELNPMDINITLVGKAEYHNELYMLLSRFFGNVNSTSKISNSHLSYLLNPHKDKFSTLFNLSQCE